MGGKKQWIPKPKSLSEKGYRKYMAKTKTVTVNEKEYTLQSVSPTWYLGHNDNCGMTGGKRNTAKYLDGLFRNCVIQPPEVKTKGIAYFDEDEDIASAEQLMNEIELFLRGRERS